MTTTQITSAREITSGTKEWADYNVNCVKGCRHDCRYCYAKIMAKRFGRTDEATWKVMVVNDCVVEGKYRKFPGRVMFPSTHDIIDDPEIKNACFKVITELLKSGNDVLITTKPSLPVIQEIVTKFAAFRPQLQFRFTITSIENDLLSFWEPGAPTFTERLTALKCAHDASFRTSVSVEPFLDHDPRELIDTVLPYVTESIWVGPMNYIARMGVSEYDEPQYARIRQIIVRENLQRIYDDLKDIPHIRFKDSMRNRLSISQGVSPVAELARV